MKTITMTYDEYKALVNDAEKWQTEAKKYLKAVEVVFGKQAALDLVKTAEAMRWI